MNLRVWFKCSDVKAPFKQARGYISNPRRLDGFSLLIIPDVPRDVLNHKRYILSIQRRVLACIKKQTWVKQFKVYKNVILKNCNFYYNASLSANKTFLPLRVENFEKYPALEVTQDNLGNDEADISIAVIIEQNYVMSHFSSLLNNRVYL